MSTIPTKSISNPMLKVGPFQVPVAIHSASDATDVSFKMCTPKGEPVKQVYLDKKGKKWTNASLSRGIEVEEGGLRVLKAEELEAIKQQGKIEGLNIDDTVPVKDLPTERTKGTYYLTVQSGGVGARSLKMVRNGLRRAKVAGVGKMMLKGRQYPFSIHAVGKTLVLTTYRFADSVRNADAYAEPIEDAGNDTTIRDGSRMAAELFAAMATDATVLDSYSDDAIEAKRDLVEKAIAGEAIKPEEEPEEEPRATEQDSADLIAALEEMVRQAAAQREGAAA